MILRREGTSRRDDSGSGPSSVPEVGRALRRERTRRGLRMEDVALRTALPLEQLEALEGGTVDRLPDRVGILKTLRRYAEFLGLPGDRYVLTLVDHWPAVSAGVAPAVVPVHSAPAVMGAGAPAAARAAYPGDPLETAAVPVMGRTRGEGNGAWDPATASVAATGSFFSEPVAPTGPVATPLEDTGVTPAVPARRVAPRSPRRTPPIALRLLVALVALLVLVGAAGLVINRYRPQWIHDLGINKPAATATGATTTRPAPARSTTTTTAPPAFTQTSATTTGATFAVRASTFSVAVSAVGGPCWLQVNTPAQVAPVFAGVLPQGGLQRFKVTQSITMEIGSKSGHVFVGVGRRLVGTYVTDVAPFTLSMHAVA